MIKTDELRGIFAKNRKSQTDVAKMLGITPKTFYGKMQKGIFNSNEIQAMIDEYIHMLKETAGFQSDGNQYQIVHDMMMDSLKIHTATYIADTYPDFKKRINGADRKSDGCRIRSSYAVGFTKDAGDNSKVVMRKENIRNAFNSPMRPFVLATTSIGQEGLDFHNYCRVIMHWNLPSNPIDLEQREGRINRFKCLAIRQNVADKYGKADEITFFTHAN